MTKSKPMDATWHPVQIKASPTIALLKRCVEQAGVYALLNTVLFAWQEMDLLASEAAVPSMWVCAMLAGYQLGKCIAKGAQ